MLWLSVRARWRRALAPSLMVALLTGVVGGFVLAAMAAARRVEGSYQTLIHEIEPPDLMVTASCGGARSELTGCQGEAGAGHDQAQATMEQLRGLSVVDRAQQVKVMRPYLVDADGRALLASSDDPQGCFEDDRDVVGVPLGAGGPLDQVLPFRLEGELPTASDRGLVLSRATTDRVGIGIGDPVRLAGWCSGDGNPIKLTEPIDLRITGLSTGAFDVEPPGTGRVIEPMFVDSSVFQAVVAAGAETSGGVAVWLDRTASAEQVEQQLASFVVILNLGEQEQLLDDALATDARLLWILAGIGAATAVLILAPIIGRNVRDTAHTPATIAALGGTPLQITQQAAAHVAVLASIGAFTSVGLAIVFSVAMPRGLAEAIVPDRQLWFDWVVTTVGAALIIVLVFAMAALPAWRAGRRTSSADAPVMANQKWGVRSLRLRPAANTGVMVAVGQPVGKRLTNPWASLISLIIAGTVGVAGLTYVAGLRHLDQTARLVGWNWDAIVQVGDSARDFDPVAVAAEISRVDGVATVTRGWLYPPLFPVESVTDREVWVWTFDTGIGGITPSILRGRAPAGPDEVAIDLVLSRAAGLGVGDSVTFSRPAQVSTVAALVRGKAQELGLDEAGLEGPAEDVRRMTFEITGIAVLPMQRTEEHPQASMTLAGLVALLAPGADEIEAAREWVPADLHPMLQEEADRTIAFDIEGAPPAFVNFSGDARSAADAVARIEGVDAVLTPNAHQVLTDGVGLNVSGQDRVPFALAIVVAVAATFVMMYLLFAGVRARRSEIAVMRALGFTSGGIRWSVAAQATVTALVPLLVATPAGIMVGRWAWVAYARDLDVIAESPVPWAQIVVVAGVAILIANAIGLVLAWSATRRSTAVDLRAE